MRKKTHISLLISLLIVIGIINFSLLRSWNTNKTTSNNGHAKPQVNTEHKEVLQSATQAPQGYSSIQFKDYSAYINSSSLSVVTINRPSSAAVYDLLLAHIAIQEMGVGSVSIIPPNGWSELRRDESTDGSLISLIYYKIMGTSEPMAYTFSLNSNRKAAGGIADYTGINLSSPIDKLSGQVTMSTGYIIAPSINAYAAGEELIMFASLPTDSQISSPTEMTKIWNAASPNGATSMMAKMYLPVAGSTGDKYATPGITGFAGIGQLIALKPAYVNSPTYSPTPTPTPTFIPTPTRTPTPTHAPTTIYYAPTPTNTPTPYYNSNTAVYNQPIRTNTPTPYYTSSTYVFPTAVPSPTPYSYTTNTNSSAFALANYPTPTTSMVIINYPVITLTPMPKPTTMTTQLPLIHATSTYAPGSNTSQKIASPTPLVPTIPKSKIPSLIIPPTTNAYSGSQIIGVEGEIGAHVEFSLQPIGNKIGSFFIGRITISNTNNKESFKWDTTNVPNGSYQLIAKFTKDDGTNFILTPVTISVANTIQSSQNSSVNDIVLPSNFNPQSIMVDRKSSIDKIANTSNKNNQVGLTFTGKSLPNTIITLLIYSNPIIVTVKTDENGTWTYTLEKPLDPGKHAVYSVATKPSGEKVRSEVAEFIIATGFAASSNNESLILESAKETQAINQFIYATVFIIGMAIVALIILFSLKMYRRQSETV